ncbi:MYCBP-associated protein [Triplophysa dalaica]|uniref:MYCBP-associated protein n=1 Tax=Triplophysa dalaica TaxID=1582913 RepID=UPI0024DF3D60|nr:MYCBP-associated protein [Triplophysa dalaica]XP_056624220.1 MYCBP-associated protein [Triplophysa dalaica]
MANVAKSWLNKSKSGRRTRSPPVSDKKPLGEIEESSSTVGEQNQSGILNDQDILNLTITSQDLEKLRVPKPPTDPQKPKSMTRVYVRKTRPPDEVGRKVRVTVARPLPPNASSQPLNYTGPAGPRFDARGMVLPHSILGSLEDFKRETALRGDSGLLQRIPETQKVTPLLVERERNDYKSEDETQHSNALQHWYRHMTERHRQQNFISRLLQRPVGHLLMNQSSRFRRIQEQRDLINRLHGQHVGCEFWNIPQHFGDELSGITATRTETERGNPPPVTRIGHPTTTRWESGNGFCDAVYNGWDRSVYLQQRRLELRDVLRDFSPPDIDGLEVVGSGLPFTSTSLRSSSLLDEENNEEQRSEMEQIESEDPLALYDDIIMDVELVPALRFCGELARWTGTTSSHQEQRGISARMMFEIVTGESVSSHLELKNEGSTVIYYSWERVTQPHTHTQHFYFNNSEAVILPGGTKHITVVFKSASAGIMTEVWQLNTHPVLMGGASLQVTLRGVAIDQDQSAHQRAALERDLHQKEAVCLCRWIMKEVLSGVCTPERPSSPVDLHITEEEQFLAHNHNLQYHREPVEALQRLWEQVKRSGQVWDLSLNTFAQMALSLPETDEQTDRLSKETCMNQYNSLVSQLQRPRTHTTPLTLHNISLQLWREMVDGLVIESVKLRDALGLPEHNVWSDKTQERNTLEKTKNEEAEQRKGGAAQKDVKRGAKDTDVKRGVKDTEGRRGGTRAAVIEERGNARINSPEEKTDRGERELHFPVDAHNQELYRRLLHTQVSALMKTMMDSLCDLLDDAQQTQQLLQNI